MLHRYRYKHTCIHVKWTNLGQARPANIQPQDYISARHRRRPKSRGAISARALCWYIPLKSRSRYEYEYPGSTPGANSTILA